MNHYSSEALFSAASFTSFDYFVCNNDDDDDQDYNINDSTGPD